jgi:hypothetical protein
MPIYLGTVPESESMNGRGEAVELRWLLDVWLPNVQPPFIHCWALEAIHVLRRIPPKQNFFEACNDQEHRKEFGKGAFSTRFL